MIMKWADLVWLFEDVTLKEWVKGILYAVGALAFAAMWVLGIILFLCFE
jgi:hypothetical protein